VRGHEQGILGTIYNKVGYEKSWDREERAMTISVDLNLPRDIEERLRAEDPDLSATVREAFAIDLFRRGILTHHGLCQTLGLDRFETDSVLKRHGVMEQSLTQEDVDADVQSLNELLAPPRP
jgi:predicted HTH domain antitoxin